MLLEVADLHAGYGAMDILEGVSLALAAGEIGVVVGPNGAGKSTTLKTIFGLLRISRGTVHFEGEEITNAAPETLVGRGMSYVPQERNVFETLTVQENLEMGCRFVPPGDRAAEIEKIYARFPRLAERRRQRARTLSGGERQMLAIGGALISGPDLLILDEPVTGLSPQLCDEVVAGIAEINRQGRTILWVVEENPQAVLGTADWVYVMEGGRVKDSTSAVALLAAPDFRQIFLGV